MDYQNKSDMPTTMLTCNRHNFQNVLESPNPAWNSFNNRIVNSSVSISKSVARHDHANFDTFSTTAYNRPMVEDVIYWMVATIAFIYVRNLFERSFFIPLGKRLGIKGRSRINKSPVIPSRISESAVLSLENVYMSSSSSKLTNLIIDNLCLKIGMNFREVERWFRKRRALDRPSTLIKFSESGWRFVSYGMSTLLGIWSMWNKPWLWDTKLCWINYPHHDMRNEVWIYYMYSSGLYTSFLLTHSFDVKRKDFWEMLVHHIITLALLGLGWAFNLTRPGAYLMLLHDCGDVFLEAAKMANYSKHESLSTGIFVGFTIVWIVTRLIIYPKKIIMELLGQALDIEQIPRAVIYTMLVLFITIFGLHLFWTYYICKIAASALSGDGKVKKDSRSSTESGSSEEDEASKMFDSKQQLTGDKNE